MLALTILAVGRLRKGPELTLISDYLDRATRTGRGTGLGPARVIEVEARRGATPAQEAEALRRAIPRGAILVALDERGRTLSSPEFATRLSDWRDEGRPELCLMIGGADGLDPDLRRQADLSLSFGAMVWPHMLVRVMLSEQLYRACAILAGTPYHRS